jgi:hypothetical protein
MAMTMVLGQATDPVEPRALPHCSYPTAADVARHGVQPLPAVLPVVDFRRARPHRSRRHAVVPADELTRGQVLDLARVVGSSFARREPQCRHLRPAAHLPAALRAARHTDPFGTDAFGPWSTESLLCWFIRLLVLTDPASPRGAIRVNAEALAQSVAILDERGRVIGGALNETMPGPDAAHAFRDGDPFLAAVLAFTEPVLTLLGGQDAEGLEALSDRYPDFAAAAQARRVGHHLMVARSDVLATADAFELVAGTAERYLALGFRYVMVEATNQWTGAACEALGGVRVHFAPFRVRPTVQRSAAALPDVATSPDGFLSAKDSGSMLYAVRLA